MSPKFQVSKAHRGNQPEQWYAVSRCRDNVVLLETPWRRVAALVSGFLNGQYVVGVIRKKSQRFKLSLCWDFALRGHDWWTIVQIKPAWLVGNVFGTRMAMRICQFLNSLSYGILPRVGELQ